MRDKKSEFIENTMMNEEADKVTNRGIAETASTAQDTTQNIEEFPEFADGITTTVTPTEVELQSNPNKSNKKAQSKFAASNEESINNMDSSATADISIFDESNDAEFKRDLDDINPNDMEDVSWGDSFDGTNVSSKKSLSVIDNHDIEFFYQHTGSDDEVPSIETNVSERIILDENGNPITTIGVFPSTDLYGPKAKHRKKFHFSRKKPKLIQKIITRGVPIILLIIVFSFAFKLVLPMIMAGPQTKVDSSVLEVMSHNQYYVGDTGPINLKKMFPQGVTFINNTPDTCSVDSTYKITNVTGDFQLTIDGGKHKNDVMNFKLIVGAHNVDNAKDLYRYAHTSPADIEAKLFKTPICITNSIIKLPKPNAKYSTIVLSNDFYGNSAKINAYSMVYGMLGDGGTGAFAVPYLPGRENPIIFRDTHVSGKEAAEDDHIKTFTNYGALLSIEGNTSINAPEQKAKCDIYNSVFEKSHKVVHLRNAEVNMEGSIVRQASDTAISIGTFANNATLFNIKNCVVADSLTGGILMYGFDGNIQAKYDNDQTWNKVNIEGFLDIYNWKKISDLAFLPDTEGKELAAIINPFIASTIAPAGSFPEFKVFLDNGDQYLHFGIIKIFTATFGKNHSDVIGFGSQGLLTEVFPIPSIAKAIMKDIRIWSYFGNNGGAVSCTSTLAEALEGNKLYEDLWNGR